MSRREPAVPPEYPRSNVRLLGADDDMPPRPPLASLPPRRASEPGAADPCGSGPADLKDGSGEGGDR